LKTFLPIQEIMRQKPRLDMLRDQPGSAAYCPAPR
jgi:hypothetical protein